ncbi:hypothetical protein D3C73_1601090 [compost metagenome]
MGMSTEMFFIDKKALDHQGLPLPVFTPSSLPIPCLHERAAVIRPSPAPAAFGRT